MRKPFTGTRLVAPLVLGASPQFVRAQRPPEAEPGIHRIVTGGFSGEVRTASGDFNGDGTEDTVIVTGRGTKTVNCRARPASRALTCGRTTAAGGCGW